ncbi:hypothetical protein C8A01DRAFT_50618 [Parachaetomium inaequale]|uniref:Uncharacterized protein n=1 Tax=Parachaetomium inaequale TaxID=2588326 RepID=A0AAN6P8C8_9PEZI|nr:hypothetical protein C8A01DRAFT_50618 [Parachaetomium inaequale]
MDTDTTDTNLHLRGGSFADGYGYNPNFTRAFPTPRRSRSKSQKRGRQQEEDQEARPDPYAPPSSAYEAVPKDPLYNRRARKLGIAESLLRPAAAAAGDAGQPWPGWVEWLVAGGGMGAAPRRRGLGELTSGEWRPTRTRFDVRWPEGELPSDWYEMVYLHMFVKVGELVRGYFGYGDVPGSEVGGGGREGRVWLEAGFSEQFMWFVEKVAMQDNNAGGWDALLTKKVLRECLVTGVIGKVLETAVFDELLFGADEVQKRMLEAQDECTLQFEGYHRTVLRSQCVRTLLADNDILTPEFWPCVDQLTLQLTTLLLPLLGFMDKHFPASRVKSLRGLYQDLHTIVAEAGYLSIGIRWSRNIFRFSLPFPGEVWDLDQEHVDDTIYKASEAANRRADLAAEDKWRAEHRRRLDERQGQANHQTLRDRGEAIIASARNGLNAVRRRVTGRGDEEDSDDTHGTKDVWHRPSRMAKVQIILWPMLQRFATVGEIDPETGAAHGENVTTVLKSQVVYYSGRADDDEFGPDDTDDHYPRVDDWVRETRRKRVWNLLGPLRWFGYAAAVWLVLSFLARFDPMADEVLQNVRHGLFEVGKYLAREAILFVLEILISIIAVFIGVVKFVMFLAYFARNMFARWRGKGFSLHPTNNTIGLAKPLLISRNTDGRGIGQKQHYTSDQWWLHAFDQKLKGLDTSKKGAVVQSVTQGKLDVIASGQQNGKYTGASGLYASFVRGGMLEGTMEVVEIVAGESTDATPATSDDSEGSVSRREKRGETKAERQARRAARRLRKANKAARKAVEARAAQKAVRKAAKKQLKSERKATETKEERRARRAERRARKEAKRRKREGAGQKSDQG